MAIPLCQQFAAISCFLKWNLFSRLNPADFKCNRGQCNGGGQRGIDGNISREFYDLSDD